MPLIEEVAGATEDYECELLNKDSFLTVLKFSNEHNLETTLPNLAQVYRKLASLPGADHGKGAFAILRGIGGIYYSTMDYEQPVKNI